MNHPTDDSLEAYAAGALGSAARAVVSLHLRGCARCRQAVAGLEALAGALLEVGEPAPLAAGALGRALAALDRPAPPAPALAALDRRLSSGWWLPIAPGIALRFPLGVADPGERLYFIRATPGAALPRHGHAGREWIVVLEGAFEDDTGPHHAGDLVETGPEAVHRPVALHAGTCLCLAATEGPLRLGGIARWLQPLFRI